MKGRLQKMKAAGKITAPFSYGVAVISALLMLVQIFVCEGANVTPGIVGGTSLKGQN